MPGGPEARRCAVALLETPSNASGDIRNQRNGSPHHARTSLLVTQASRSVPRGLVFLHPHLFEKT
jgi:hypothetical protein